MNYTTYWLALSRVHGMGPAHLREIHDALQKAGLSIADITDLSPDELKGEFGFQEAVCAAVVQSRDLAGSVEADYERCLNEGISVIPFFAELYPQRLLAVLGNAFPPFLYALCGAQLMTRRGAAILGDSNVSDKGELIAYSAARELASHRIVVISGYARGADQIAHRSALQNGGETAAFLPSGIFRHKIPQVLADVFDPERIAVVSPFYPSVEMDQFTAMIRNRIICALSRAVYVIEAPAEGGVFEAAKSAHHLKIPLFTTEYTEYPKNAPGNKKIIDELSGIPVRGRMVNNMLSPNMDRIIASVKFD